MMDSLIGYNVKSYRNVILRNSKIGDHSIIGDDAFITGSTIGKRCTIERRGMIFNSTVGDYSYTGYNTVVKHSTIGKFSSISWNVSIGGANHDYHRISTHPFSFMSKYGFIENNGQYASFSDPLTIGNDVWIGSNSVILRGIKIGDGAVVGAGAVITKDVPPYAIVVGNPGKVINYRFSQEIIEKLVEIKWWNWSHKYLCEQIQCFQSEQITMEFLYELIENHNKYIHDEEVRLRGCRI